MATRAAQAETREGALEDGDPIRDILLSASLDDTLVVTADTSDHALTTLMGRGLRMERDLTTVIANAVRPAVRTRQHIGWIDQVVVRELERQLVLSPRHEAAHAQIAAFDIPLADHPLVDAYIDYFTGRGRLHFAKWLARLERYRPIMEPVLTKYGLPKDLVFVALIESGLSSSATSTAAACGFWQFIRSTGTMYGMRMDFWIDERRDFIRATDAAARYLKSLNREFGDWHLAWASYNAGSGRVSRAMTRYEANDYWTLISHERSVAKETRHYVPKIIAAAIIAKDRARFGFGDVQPESPLTWEEVEVTDAVDLRVVARQSKVDIEALRELNPALLHDVTPPGRRWRLRVPTGLAEPIAKWLENLPTSERLTYRHYTVQKGDTLSAIAKRHGTTINAISEFNRIRNARLLRPGQNLIIPTVRKANVINVPVATKGRNTSPVKEAKVVTRAAAPKKHHLVQKGDTLWSIATRYGVGVEQLKSRNGRETNAVMAGERLKIF